MDKTVMNVQDIGITLNSSRSSTYNESGKSEDQFIQTSSFPPVASDLVRDDSRRFLLIPLAVLLGIIALSALVYLMARNRRRFAHISWIHRRTPDIIFDDSDTDMEILGDDDDYDGLNDPTESLLKGKLQIDNRPRYEDYQTTHVTINGFGKSDLFT